MYLYIEGGGLGNYFFLSKFLTKSVIPLFLFFSFQIKYFLGCPAITAAWFYFSISFPDSHHSIFITTLVYSSLHQLQRQLSMHWTGAGSVFFVLFFCCFFFFFSLTEPAVFVTRADIISASNGTTVAITSKSITRLKLLHIHGPVELRLRAMSAALVAFCHSFGSAVCSDILLTFTQRQLTVSQRKVARAS